MKNTFGQSVAVTLFGESHGAAIGAVLDGLAPGIPVDEGFITAQLDLRRPFGKISTARQEADPFQIVSGCFEGKTTGTPLTILIPNGDTKSKDYSKTKDLARPGHADLTAQLKYHGYQDFRGGGHFSGRLTAPLCIAGGLCKQWLEEMGIRIGAHIAQIGFMEGEYFSPLNPTLDKIGAIFPTLSAESAEFMQQTIAKARSGGESVGGIIECAITGLPAGIGEPMFGGVESKIAQIVYGIPAVKALEFGQGSSFAVACGSMANDAYTIEDGEIKTVTNHCGGILGGITNGMPIVFRTAIKPTPTIFKPQQTIDFKDMTDVVLSPKGRHDPAIVHRARAVQDAAAAIVMCDALAMRFGTDWLK